MTSKTIKICGKDVEIFYCAATENGYERMSGKEINVFLPTFKKNEHGETVIDKMPEATSEDYIILAIAGVVAAATYRKQEPAITSDDLLYEAKPTERNELVTTIIELRNEWYEVPKIVEEIARKENAKAGGDTDTETAKN